MAERYGAELLLLQVVVPENLVGAAADNAATAQAELDEMAAKLAGPRGRARVVFDSDPSQAIVDAAADDEADVVVVGNVGMSERSEFLLGSVPNRVSHNAPCTVVIVNTADGAQPGVKGGRAASRQQDVETSDVEAGQLLGRAAHIGTVLARHGLKMLLESGPGDDSTVRAQARQFKEALQELGPTFAKLGQILSTRPDLLPPAFVEELSTLQDRVTPLTEAEVVAVMEQELRVPWEDVFQHIEADPMAAGTIAQVHRAVLSNGDRVVVKVQRPTAKDEILQDLGLLEMFTRKAAGRPAFNQVVDLPAIIEHLSVSLRRELDFRQEAANVERMRDVLAPFPRLDVPRIYGDLSSARLLVMEEVQGGPIREAPEGEARREAARQLLESYYSQVLSEGFFHADPHPGNLMWWQDKIYFLDFGMIGEVDPGTRELMLLMLLAFWQEDATFLTEVMLMLAGEQQRSDIDQKAFQAELGDLISQYRHLSLQELRLGPMLQQMTEISVRHNVRLPASLALTGKAFGQMQLATAELDPTLDPFSVAGSFFFKRLAQEVRGSANPQRLFYEAQKLRLRIVRLLEAFERMAGVRPGPKLQVDFRGVDQMERTIRGVGRRIAMSMTAAAALLATGIIAGSGRGSTAVIGALGVVTAVLVLAVFLDFVRGRP
jgi:predicted unusual protein kinase regulating ubiquinone biosynthesis (AarF/ABC1/UbiB family)